MTDERKQAEEMLKVRYRDYKWEPAFTNIAEFAAEFAALKLAEATREMYPKAYTRWLFWNEYYMTEEGLFSPIENMPKGMMDELFESWKQKIRK